MIIQFCGLSGSGKTTLAGRARELLNARGIKVEILDGDDYRKVLCSDLGFSKKDRNTNIRRLAFVAGKLSQHGIVAFICAINPYDEIRREVEATYPDVHTVYINCGLEELLRRDTKGLYRKAMLPEGHPDRIDNLTGVNDPFETPTGNYLAIRTDEETVDEGAEKIVGLVLTELSKTNGIKQL